MSKLIGCDSSRARARARRDTRNVRIRAHDSLTRISLALLLHLLLLHLLLLLLVAGVVFSGDAVLETDSSCRSFRRERRAAGHPIDFAVAKSNLARSRDKCDGGKIFAIFEIFARQVESLLRPLDLAPFFAADPKPLVREERGGGGGNTCVICRSPKSWRVRWRISVSLRLCLAASSPFSLLFTAPSSRALHRARNCETAPFLPYLCNYSVIYHETSKRFPPCVYQMHTITR